MNKFRLTIKLLAIAIFMLAFASMTQAQATRTWVSGVGDDANPCSRTAPCKTFAGAISKTATNGEISVLDPGGFGAVTITKGLTINGEGTLAGILSALTNAIIINAPATDTVNIRYVSINGAASGVDGIRILSAKNVNIDNVSITGVTGDGIEVLTGANVNVSITNSSIKNCAGAGLKAETSAGQVRVTIDQSTFMGCGQGLLAHRNSRIMAKDSGLVSNGVGGFSEGNGGTSVIELENCMIAMNSSHGVQAGGGAATNTSIVRISDCHITNNSGAGASVQANGTVNTFMNNEIIANSPDGCVGCTNSSGSFN
jgi:parallel beta helix pectate lyase-like protein